MERMRKHAMNEKLNKLKVKKKVHLVDTKRLESIDVFSMFIKLCVNLIE